MKSTNKPYFKLTNKLYIEEEIAFSEDMIREFCEVIKDEDTKRHPKIVPKMQILSRALANIHSIGYADLFSQGRLIKAYFEDILKVDEHAAIGFVPESNSDEIEMYAKRKGKNVLAVNDNISVTHNHGNQLDFFLTAQGVIRTANVSDKQLDAYAKIMGLAPKNSGVRRDPASDFLFTIAYSSHALMNCVNEPKSELEHKINNLMREQNPSYPEYNSLSIMRNEKAPKEIQPGELTFLTQIIKLDEIRYEARIHCSQDRNGIYSAIYGITMTPKNVLDEMLKQV